MDELDVDTAAVRVAKDTPDSPGVTQGQQSREDRGVAHYPRGLVGGDPSE